MADLNELLKDYKSSSYRENILEQIFCAELLQAAWCVGLPLVEIDRPFVDFRGYDLVASCGPITRHIQLKATNNAVSVHEALASKPSGCVINLQPSVQGDPPRITFAYRFFGEKPGQPLVLGDFKHAKKTMNSLQESGAFGKSERLSHFVIPSGPFQPIKTSNELVVLLFGNPSVGM